MKDGRDRVETRGFCCATKSQDVTRNLISCKYSSSIIVFCPNGVVKTQEFGVGITQDHVLVVVIILRLVLFAAKLVNLDGAAVIIVVR